MMQCIAFATADQYHLPTLCHDLMSHGFSEIDLPRGTKLHSEFGSEQQARLLITVFISDASNVLVISSDTAAKPDDNALTFFFRCV